MDSCSLTFCKKKKGRPKGITTTRSGCKDITPYSVPFKDSCNISQLPLKGKQNLPILKRRLQGKFKGQFRNILGQLCMVVDYARSVHTRVSSDGVAHSFFISCTNKTLAAWFGMELQSVWVAQLINRRLWDLMELGVLIAADNGVWHSPFEDEPNFQVSFRDENDKEYTFYVNAENVDSAIDSAYNEFSLNHGLSIKGEVSFEDDIPAGERNNYIEVNTNYAPKVNIAADPYDGSGIRVTRVPDYLLPAFVNGDTSGLEDEDLNSLEELEKELESEGINPSLTFPVCGPDGEYWDNDEFGDGVLCSARV